MALQRRPAAHLALSVDLVQRLLLQIGANARFAVLAPLLAIQGLSVRQIPPLQLSLSLGY